MKLSYFSILVIILAVLHQGIAQSDTSYIEPLAEQTMLALHTTFKNFRMELESPNSTPLIFQKQNLALGVRGRFKKVGLSISVPAFLIGKDQNTQGKSYNVGVALFHEGLFAQGNLRYMQGFEQEEAFNPNQQFFRPDIRLWHTNFDLFYIFNHKKFSLPSAFRMVDKQKRNAGSPVISALFLHQNIKADSLPLFFPNSTDLASTGFELYKTGLGAGYAYTWVFNPYWSATAMVTAGANFRKFNYFLEEAQQQTTNWEWSGEMRYLGSVLYDAGEVFYGVNFHYIPSVDKSRELTLGIKDWFVRLQYGWRF